MTGRKGVFKRNARLDRSACAGAALSAWWRHGRILRKSAGRAKRVSQSGFAFARYFPAYRRFLSRQWRAGRFAPSLASAACLAFARVRTQRHAGSRRIGPDLCAPHKRWPIADRAWFALLRRRLAGTWRINQRRAFADRQGSQSRGGRARLRGRLVGDDEPFVGPHARGGRRVDKQRQSPAQAYRVRAS